MIIKKWYDREWHFIDSDNWLETIKNCINSWKKIDILHIIDNNELQQIMFWLKKYSLIIEVISDNYFISHNIENYLINKEI